MVTGPSDAPPDALPPDDRDWTWVLERPCPDCGFDASPAPAAGLGAEARAVGSRVGRPAGSRATCGSASVRTGGRLLEYGCHVRDVLRLADERIGLLLARTTRCSPTGTRTARRWPSGTTSRIPMTSGPTCWWRPRCWPPAGRRAGRPVGPAGLPVERQPVHRRVAGPLHRPRPGPSPVGRLGAVSGPRPRGDDVTDHRSPRLQADEVSTLMALLQYQRDSLVRKVEGVTPSQAAWTPVPSGTNLLWLVTHMADAEQTWMVRRFAGLATDVGEEPPEGRRPRPCRRAVPGHLGDGRHVGGRGRRARGTLPR